MKRFLPLEFVSSITQFLSSSFDIIDALKSMAEEKSANGLTAKSILADINDGLKFSTSFEKNIKHKELIKFIPLIKASEGMGRLNSCLFFINEYLSEKRKNKEKIMLSLLYPSFILLTLVLVFLVLSLYVVPRIDEVLNMIQGEGNINAISVKQFAFVFAVVVLMLVATVISIMTFSRASDRVCEVLDKVVYKFPIIGKQRTATDIGQLSFLMAMFLKSGMTSDMALRLTSESLRRGHLKKEIEKASLRVCEGDGLSSSLSYIKMIPEFYISSLSKGEKTADIQGVFQRLYEYYNSEKKRRSEILAKLIEPVMTLILGLVMFGFVLVFVRPLFTMLGGTI